MRGIVLDLRVCARMVGGAGGGAGGRGRGRGSLRDKAAGEEGSSGAEGTWWPAPSLCARGGKGGRLTVGV